MVEGEAVGAERGEAEAVECRRIVHPLERGAAGRRRAPDPPLEGIRDVDVAGRVEGERVRARAIGPDGGERREDRRCTRLRIHFQHLLPAEIANQQVARRRIECDAEQQRTAAGHLQRAQPAAAAQLEHDDVADRGVPADVEIRDVEIATGVRGDAFRMRSAGRQRCEPRGRAAIPCRRGRCERREEHCGERRGEAREMHDLRSPVR